METEHSLSLSVCVSVCVCSNAQLVGYWAAFVQARPSHGKTSPSANHHHMCVCVSLSLWGVPRGHLVVWVFVCASSSLFARP
jgi:hypothetical protein